MKVTVAERAWFIATLSLGYAENHPAWLIVLGIVALVVALALAVWVYLRLTDDPGTRGVPRRVAREWTLPPASMGEALVVPHAPELHHEWLPQTPRHAAGLTPHAGCQQRAGADSPGPAVPDGTPGSGPAAGPGTTSLGPGAGAETPGYNSHLTSPLIETKMDSPAPDSDLFWCIYCETETPNGIPCPACGWNRCARCQRCIDQTGHDHQTPGAAEPSQGAPPAAPGLTPATAPALAILDAITAPLAIAAEAQKWPHLMPGQGYGDTTGEFTKLAEGWDR